MCRTNCPRHPLKLFTYQEFLCVVILNAIQGRWSSSPVQILSSPEDTALPLKQQYGQKSDAEQAPSSSPPSRPTSVSAKPPSSADVASGHGRLQSSKRSLESKETSAALEDQDSEEEDIRAVSRRKTWIFESEEQDELADEMFTEIHEGSYFLL